MRCLAGWLGGSENDLRVLVLSFDQFLRDLTQVVEKHSYPLSHLAILSVLSQGLAMLLRVASNCGQSSCLPSSPSPHTLATITTPKQRNISLWKL